MLLSRGPVERWGGPKNFYNFFSTNQGIGYPIKRKDDKGKIVSWEENTSSLRMSLLPLSYLEREILARSFIESFRKNKEVKSESQEK